MTDPTDPRPTRPSLADALEAGMGRATDHARDIGDEMDRMLAELNAPSTGVGYQGPALGDLIAEGLSRVLAKTEAEVAELNRLLRELGVDPDALDAEREAEARAKDEQRAAGRRDRGTLGPGERGAQRGGRVSREALRVLSTSTIEGSSVRLPEQLPRKLYEEVDAVLQACGGKWSRGKGVHLFTVDPAELLNDVINSGEVKRKPDLGWFPTPAPLAADLVRRARVAPGMTAWEPSAGRGAIALALRAAGASVLCAELDPGRAQDLRALGFEVREGDALAERVPPVDRVVMNPPFGKQADLAHIRHAHAQLAAGGLLVSVMGGGVLFREDARTEEFRAWVASLGGTLAPLPEGSFQSAGTAVSTAVLVLPADPAAPPRAAGAAARYVVVASPSHPGRWTVSDLRAGTSLRGAASHEAAQSRADTLNRLEASHDALARR